MQLKIQVEADLQVSAKMESEIQDKVIFQTNMKSKIQVQTTSQFLRFRTLLDYPVGTMLESKFTSMIQTIHQFCLSMVLFLILQSSLNADPLSLRFLVILFNTFSSSIPFQGCGGPAHHNPFQGLGGPTHRIFRIFTFEDAVMHSILEMKKIIEKEVIAVHQQMEIKITIYQLQVFKFEF